MERDGMQFRLEARSLSRRRFLKLAGAGSLGMLFAGCAPGNEPDYTVRMMDNDSFSPSSLIVPIRSLVAWHNAGARLHTATFDPDMMTRLAGAPVPQGAGHWDSGDLYDGQTWRYRFDTPGDYVYFCRYHVGDGMVGLITVIA